MILQHWGATPQESAAPVVGDELCADARVIATRCITIGAPPEDVFPWLRQMGFGRAGWYSYDLLDNLGRHSANRIHDEWQDIVTGSSVPGGPASFEAAVVDPPRSFVLRTPTGATSTGRLCFTLAYALRDVPEGTRLVTRVRIRVNFPGGRMIERLLGLGDGIMVRKQLLTLGTRVATQGPPQSPQFS
jgi:hypothetical protein